ncbi:MAG: YihA family ribosome biogenesis GTP-binding protein [Desulfobacteraceae bacterium]|nr:YihA family ribosome biogenesis GTP-binding protein [Desulfobacteraceae bacterium]MBC2754417.1 YihA family ribosome biogenesis GTP-binding protein [Desulfobacteraceae bacterium]
MIIKSAEFVVSATRPGNYPPENLPEIAFAGRSNVGKSTLINKLVNRKHLVKTSSTPGRTQLLNFFNINEAFVFVDLPGYGYAKVPERVKKDWGKMIETYLSTRSTLKGVVLILDIRRNPGEDEHNFISWLHQQEIPTILILTKADKLSKTKQKKQVQLIEKALSINPEGLICFSAKTRQGLDNVWKAIEYCIEDSE